MAVVPTTMDAMHRLLLPLTLVMLVGCASAESNPESTPVRDAGDVGTATDTANTDTAVADTRVDDVGDTALAPCAPGGSGAVLECFDGCAPSLFGGSPEVEEFDDATAYAAKWKGAHTAPTVAGGALVFGPHPLNTNWWENYSPTTSVNTSYGDVLICLRFRMTPTLMDDSQSGQSLELFTRLASGAAFETSGMVLNVLGSTGRVTLHTRLGESMWAFHDEKKLAWSGTTEHVVDAILYGRGDRFVGEIKADKLPVVALKAKHSVPATGAIGLLGWRNNPAVYVDRLIVGTPQSSVAARLETKLP